jgi:hypothetical protein
VAPLIGNAPVSAAPAPPEHKSVLQGFVPTAGTPPARPDTHFVTYRYVLFNGRYYFDIAPFARREIVGTCGQEREWFSLR